MSNLFSKMVKNTCPNLMLKLKDNLKKRNKIKSCQILTRKN